MTENASADAAQSRQAGFVRCCLYYITRSAQKTIAFFPKSVYNSSMHVVWNVCKGGNE